MKNDEKDPADIKVDLSVQADFKPLLESTPSGFRRVFELLFGGRQARIGRQTRLIEAQTDVDVQKILRGEVEYNPTADALLNLEESNVGNLIRHDIEMEETSNLLGCSKHAAINLEESSSDASSDDEISRDFILRWRNEAKFISDETAQAIWGRILAEEVNHPGAISPRSLDVIKNLSKHEALVFKKACSFVAFDDLLVDNTKGQPLSPVEFVTLRDCGLIASYSKGMYRGTSWQETNLKAPDGSVNAIYYIKASKYFIFIAKDHLTNSQAPSFSYWELTKAGRELYTIIEKTIDDDIFSIVEGLRDGYIGKVYYTTYIDSARTIIDLNNVREL
ncbi:DUF2806 domain-containing protein [Pseudomonas putida]|uniref:DUF2806 domain-containing protein n=1 Tax=Pseudomonas putida TaxID=303 RepID=UPI002768D716|nr:DUF2806 domain-containing protein [Pseudomonas putida]MDP9523681.1 DUF2806 domain-containing protein [Pseudomonas putida]